MGSRQSWAALTVAAALAGAPVAAQESGSEPLRLLLVGSSYLYVNDVAAVVQQLAASRGARWQATLLAKPNYAIEDHIGDGGLQAALADGDYDWVILQQGPSSQPDSRAHLRLWAGRAATLARADGARVALFSAWPALPNAHTWLDAELSYREAAVAHDACVLPVATAWRYLRQEQAGVQLYHPDQLHPTPAGTLLAALTVVRGLLGGPYRPDAPDPAALPDDSAWHEAGSAIAALDRSARRAVLDSGPRCILTK